MCENQVFLYKFLWDFKNLGTSYLANTIYTVYNICSIQPAIY